ncbi:hypothetical protein C4573_07235 [Candidatus Woesearchaeota archaeon]|nr:MAG: hypothetical protein C4573_07235 [Candidatus Woesearchaeota archaeon]
MSKLKSIFKSWKVIILVIVLLLAILAISPRPWQDGLAIRSVAKDSAAAVAGIQNPKAGVSPVALERVLAVNNIEITTEEQYGQIVGELPVNTTFILKTSKNIYSVTVKPAIEVITLNETEEQVISEFDAELNQTVNKTIKVNKTQEKVIGAEDIGLRVYQAPTDNIRKGLDLSGGTRVLLKPQEKVSNEDMDILIEGMKQRLNVFGLSDVTIRPTDDLAGNTFILVEIAGANVEEVKELLSNQGKFEAKIANQTVFRGGQDITSVCRTAQCSGLDSRRGCSLQGDSYVCGFLFSISLDPEAAKRQAELTKNLPVDYLQGEGFLNESLELYLDNELMDSLRIGESLKGKAVTDISISGSGTGFTQQEAVADALTNMKRLQTILITGSLPVKLDIVKTDSITPVLGQSFSKNILLVAVLTIISVSLVMFIRYRKMIIVLPVVITLIAEIVILLGVAAVIRWQLDLVAIAGIIIAIGTGVDSQVVIIDEMLRKEQQSFSNWKDRIKNAFFIIMASYFTLVVAMIPLFTAGAGLLKGFALTTIIGVSIGVFITRPAFAKMTEVLLKDEH